MYCDVFTEHSQDFVQSYDHKYTATFFTRHDVAGALTTNVKAHLISHFLSISFVNTSVYSAVIRVHIRDNQFSSVLHQPTVTTSVHQVISRDDVPRVRIGGELQLVIPENWTL